MSLDIMLNKRVFFPAYRHKDPKVVLSMQVEGYEQPSFDTNKIVSINVRLGDFSGYDFADFLGIYTTESGNAQSVWLFGRTEAMGLIEAIDEEAYGGEMPEQHKRMKGIIREELDKGTDTFEFMLC